MMADERIQELLELAAQESITLPYSPELIVAMEDTGAVVDLHTGSILVGEADTVYSWTLTPQGEVMARLLKGQV